MINKKHLQHQIQHCQKCRLSLHRKHAVAGEGKNAQKIFILGEAPGAQEDATGKPFVGKAGLLLKKALQEEVGLEEKDLFFTNVVKCHPPKNRPPRVDEVTRCHPYLVQEIALIQPKIIIALGKVATLACYALWNIFYKKNFRMQEIQGKIYPIEKGNRTLICLYHPAYFLHRQASRIWEKNWDSLRNILKTNH